MISWMMTLLSRLSIGKSHEDVLLERLIYAADQIASLKDMLRAQDERISAQRIANAELQSALAIATAGVLSL